MMLQRTLPGSIDQPVTQNERLASVSAVVPLLETAKTAVVAGHAEHSSEHQTSSDQRCP